MKNKKIKQLMPILIISIFVAVIVYYMNFLPTVGSSDTPANRLLRTATSKILQEHASFDEIGQHIVTDVRGFDTILETLVIYITGLCCTLILFKGENRKRVFGHFSVEGDQDLKVILPIALPIILLYTGYSFVVKHSNLGSGFKTGAMLALAYIVYTMAKENQLNRFPLNQRRCLFISTVAMMIIVIVASMPIAFGGDMMQFYAIGKIGVIAQDAIISFLELCITVVVAMTLINILETVIESSEEIYGDNK